MYSNSSLDVHTSLVRVCGAYCMCIWHAKKRGTSLVVTSRYSYSCVFYAVYYIQFFAVDDLRPEINAFGVDGASPIPGTNVPKMHTPNIDALAAKSLVLTKNYVQQAVCSPTRASLLTGRRPDRTRTYDLYSYFRTVGGNFTTIPEHFMQSGYQTIG